MSPLTTIKMKTHMEMWIGKLVDYSSLHIFGRVAYVMYNDQERIKLDLKSKRCIFLGYADGVNGYRLWNPIAYKVIISRDEIFVKDLLQSEEGDNTFMKKNKYYMFNWKQTIRTKTTRIF